MAICRRGASGWVGSLALLLAGSSVAVGQMHYVKKQGTVVRAVGVYEWTGDLVKPNASRLIPVSIFIDGKLEDAGVYLARPVPMALETGTVFELDKAGVPAGLLDLAFARHLEPSAASTADPYDDGWFGYGTFKAQAASRPVLASNKVRQSKALLQSSKPDTAGPHLTNNTEKAGSTNSGSKGSTTQASSGSGDQTSNQVSNDPSRPTLTRRDESSSGSSATPTRSSSTPPGTPSPGSSGSANSAPAASDDPDRPTLTRRDGSSSSGSTSTQTASTGSGSSTSSGTPDNDPDRPTIKRRTDSSGSGNTSAASDTSGTSSASSTASTDNDPDRPVLNRRSGSGDTGSTSSTTSAGTTPADDPDRPTLRKRTPAENRQALKENADSSVSGYGSLNDDPNRPTLHRGKPAHALTADDLPKLTGLPVDLQQMAAVSDAVNRPEHNFARPWESTAEHDEIQNKMEDLARMKLVAYLNPTAPAQTAAATPAKKPTPAPNTPAARAAARKAKAAAAAAAAPLALTEEVLKAYTLSYDGAPTFCLSATSLAKDGTARYVTLVTQLDANHDLKVAFSNVTDSQHLDRTPRYRLVDVVDAEASNRASLLFEMRAQQSRSFALYRVIGAQAEQIFSTGSTQ